MRAAIFNVFKNNQQIYKQTAVERDFDWRFFLLHELLLQSKEFLRLKFSLLTNQKYLFFDPNDITLPDSKGIFALLVVNTCVLEAALVYF